MANLPYVNSTGALRKLLEKIKEAQTPQTFTHDYLNTKLGISERAMIPLLKRINFLDQSSVPTLLYKNFRNPNKTKTSMAAAIKKGYSDLYSMNEYVHNLSDSKLKDLIVQVTGNDHDSSATKATKNTFLALKEFASFDELEKTINGSAQEKNTVDDSNKQMANYNPQSTKKEALDNQSIGLNLGYTINLNLPETTDIEVFNAIFKSLSEHFLQK
ncbi:DUF5343 domain-containing protein [bacterium]|nr:DUF5343 domain-containing protein [bacterium]